MATTKAPAKAALKATAQAAAQATKPSVKLAPANPANLAKPASAAAKAVKIEKAEKVEKAEKMDKPDKAKKPKLVRDSFTIPKTEYTVLEALKQRAAQAGAPAKKSELLRAGIKALAAMPEPAFLAAMGAVPAIKTGRPAKD